MEGLLRARDKEAELLGRQLEAAKAAEATSAALRAQAEEAGQKLQGELSQARNKQPQLEAQVRVVGGSRGG